jgi:hypothetical protein
MILSKDSLAAIPLSKISALFLFLVIGPWTVIASTKIPRSRCFNGITATFEITNPIIRTGEDLKVVVVYRNTGSETVHFRFFHVDEDADVYRRGEKRRLIGGFTGEPAPLETTLKPGQSFRFEDKFDMKGWSRLKPGDYEIRFGYHLGLLGDESLIRKYRASYPHDGYVVPWTDHRYPFTLVR